MMALEHPLAGAMAHGAGTVVRLELVDGGVIRQFEQDHVVEIPAVRDVVPAEDFDAKVSLVTLDLAREYLAHEKLEKRVAATADREKRGQNGHGVRLRLNDS